MAKTVLNLPTKITVIRLALIPLMVVLFFINNRWVHYSLFIVYILAVSTDKLDGYLARSRNMVTPFGAFLDPLVGKLPKMGRL